VNKITVCFHFLIVENNLLFFPPENLKCMLWAPYVRLLHRWIKVSRINCSLAFEYNWLHTQAKTNAYACVTFSVKGFYLTHQNKEIHWHLLAPNTNMLTLYFYKKRMAGMSLYMRWTPHQYCIVSLNQYKHYVHTEQNLANVPWGNLEVMFVANVNWEIMSICKKCVRK